MLRTRHRVFIDIEVSAHELSVGQVLHRAQERSREIRGFEELIPAFSPPDREALAPQRALQEELLRTPGAIDPWARSQIMWTLQDEGLEDIVHETAGEDLLAPLFERLSSPAKERLLSGRHDRERVDPLLNEFYFSFECEVLAAALNPTYSTDPELRPGDVYRQRYRAIVDVRTSILDLCPRRVRKRRAEAARVGMPIEPDELWRWPELDESELPMATQLQEELIRHPDALDAYLKREVLYGVNSNGLRQLGEPLGDEDMMVWVDRLSPRDQGWFHAARARGELYDSLSEFYGSFSDEILEIGIFEVPGSRVMA